MRFRLFVISGVWWWVSHMHYFVGHHVVGAGASAFDAVALAHSVFFCCCCCAFCFFIFLRHFCAIKWIIKTVLIGSCCCISSALRRKVRLNERITQCNCFIFEPIASVYDGYDRAKCSLNIIHQYIRIVALFFVPCICVCVDVCSVHTKYNSILKMLID